MTKPNQITLFALVGALALGGGYVVANYTASAASKPAPLADPAPLLGTTFQDLEGKPQKLAQWQRQVLVVNFWATWCPPCLEEIPALIALQQKYPHVRFVGIALDQKNKVQTFTQQLKINYPVWIGEIDAIDLSKKAGNRLGGLPYTVVIGSNGKIEYSEMGGTSELKLSPVLDRLGKTSK